MLDPRLSPHERAELAAREVDWRDAWAGPDAGGRTRVWPAAAAVLCERPALELRFEALVLGPVEPLRERPAHAAQQISEIRQGERLRVLLEEEGGWWLVCGEDGYVGWLRAWSSRRLSPRTWRDLQERRGARYARGAGLLTAEDGGALCPLFLGTPLLEGPRPGTWSLVDGCVGRVEPGAAEAAAPSGDPSDLVVAASRLLGAPYRWGGGTAGGIDCSGLVQVAALWAGFDLPRDAAQQARVGEEVDLQPAAWRPGDLLFFHEPVDHVAVVEDPGRILHARGRVRRDLWAEVEDLRRGLVKVRRLCASERSRGESLWRVAPRRSPS